MSEMHESSSLAVIDTAKGQGQLPDMDDLADRFLQTIMGDPGHINIIAMPLDGSDEEAEIHQKEDASGSCVDIHFSQAIVRIKLPPTVKEKIEAFVAGVEFNKDAQNVDEDSETGLRGLEIVEEDQSVEGLHPEGRTKQATRNRKKRQRQREKDKALRKAAKVAAEAAEQEGGAPNGTFQHPLDIDPGPSPLSSTTSTHTKSEGRVDGSNAENAETAINDDVESRDQALLST